MLGGLWTQYRTTASEAVTAANLRPAGGSRNRPHKKQISTNAQKMNTRLHGMRVTLADTHPNLHRSCEGGCVPAVTLIEIVSQLERNSAQKSAYKAAEDEVKRGLACPSNG